MYNQLSSYLPGLTLPRHRWPGHLLTIYTGIDLVSTHHPSPTQPVTGSSLHLPFLELSFQLCEPQRQKKLKLQRVSSLHSQEALQVQVPKVELNNLGPGLSSITPPPALLPQGCKIIILLL